MFRIRRRGLAFDYWLMYRSMKACYPPIDPECPGETKHMVDHAWQYRHYKRVRPEGPCPMD